MMIPLLRKIIPVSVTLLILAACTPAQARVLDTATAPAAVVITQTSQYSSAPTSSPEVTESPTPFLLQSTSTATLAPTPTIVPRQPAEDWQEWPVKPVVTTRAIEIYRKGLAAGTDPTHFSKVGDCQSIQEAFMGFFDNPLRYTLVDEHASLQETVDNFKGSFERDGMAVHGGFTAASPLSPMLANPDFCQPGENPLECEFRIHNPSIVFINIEVWWDGRTPETYTRYMRKLIDFAIEHGAVPILATKADNVEGDYSINLATAKLALEYDIPLWNFWLAVQPLANHGLRDTFHISYEAWSTHSYAGLEALDTVWKGVRVEEAGD